MKLFVALLIFCLCVASHAINSRGRVMQSEGSGDEGESSHSAQATINRKLGFAFVLDNGNDIETVHETHTTHVMLEENKKQGSKEATEKQKQRDVDYSAVMEKINKENQEFSEKTQKTEQVQKNEASAEQNKKSEASSAEQNKKSEDSAAEKAQKSEASAEQKKKSDAAAEQTQKSEAAAAEQKQKKADQDALDKKYGLVFTTAIYPSQANVVLKPDDTRLQFSGAYTYSFWVKPSGVSGGWTNIIHKGDVDGNRNPAIWFIPGNLGLHCRSGTSDDWNHGCNSNVQLPINQWSHVVLVHDSNSERLYINGQPDCTAGGGPPLANSGSLYVSNRWYTPAQAQVANLHVFQSAATDADIAALFKDKRGTS